MPLRAWLAALQAPLFSAVLSPAAVGVAVAMDAGASPTPFPLVLLFLALVFVQAGANLQKGLVESADRPGPATEVPSVYVFDSGAVERLGWSRRRLRLLTIDLFVLGGVAGLALVWNFGDLLLLALGAAGGFLGFFYSAPPLKLSYRGVGEIPTFLAFGPLLVVGATYLFAGEIRPLALWAGVVMGFLAALISYERYFPVAEEDASKGKRTPVVRLGTERATRVLWMLLVAPYLTALAGGLLGQPALLPFLATAPVAYAMARAHHRAAEEPKAYGTATQLAVALHALGGLVLVGAVLLL